MRYNRCHRHWSRPSIAAVGRRWRHPTDTTPSGPPKHPRPCHAGVWRGACWVHRQCPPLWRQRQVVRHGQANRQLPARRHHGQCRRHGRWSSYNRRGGDASGAHSSIGTSWGRRRGSRGEGRRRTREGDVLCRWEHDSSEGHVLHLCHRNGGQRQRRWQAHVVTAWVRTPGGLRIAAEGAGCMNTCHAR